MIIELEDQLEPLENQSRIAREYKALTEFLKEKNIQVYVHEIDKTHQEWRETERLHKELSNEQLQISSKVSQHHAVIEEKRWLADQMEKEIESLHQRLLQVSEEVEKTEGKREVLRERSKNQKTLQSQTLQNIKTLQVKKIELANQCQAQKQQFENATKEIERLSQNLKQEEDSLDNLLNNHHEQVEHLKEDYFELLNHMASLRNEIRHLESSKESIQYRLNKLQSEFMNIEKERTQINDKKENAVKELNLFKTEIDRLGQEYREKIHLQRNIAEQINEKSLKFNNYSTKWNPYAQEKKY